MMDDENKKQPINNQALVSRYRGTMGEMSNTELGLSSWYLRHRALLALVGKWIVGVVGIGLLLFSLFQWGAYLFFGYTEDEAFFLRQVREAPNYAAIHPLYEARDVQVVRPDIFASAPGRYDFVSDVTNPNDRWVAMITYQYVHSRGQTELKETILMPGVTRPVVVFGEEVGGVPSNARLVITNIDWIKINAHVIPDVAGYMSERLVFDYENVDFVGINEIEGAAAHQISFDLINNTAYSYWQPLFYIELFDGNRRAGVLPLVLEQFQSGDVQNVDLRSVAEQLRVDRIVVYPVINVFDAREFMEPGT